ncbi:hypothetical protein ACGF3K_07910 [Streptomyces sp. NPDC047980]|uniref:hypothetical protein n=1 Tax=unclassified Streptomyces TaxID=2593676 RepID=UPI0036AE6705
MRKTVTATALALAAVLLTGCGDGSGKHSGGRSGEDGRAGGTQRTATPDAGGDAKGTAKREVTLEVLGTGTAQVAYHLDTSKFEQVTLPWKKTATIELTAAEQQVGRLVSVVPGSIQGSDGLLQAAPCVITVDGRKVADNQEGKVAKPCQFRVK